jgi:hypothetical protein
MGSNLSPNSDHPERVFLVFLSLTLHADNLMKEADVPLKKCHTAKTLHSRTQNMK